VVNCNVRSILFSTGVSEIVNFSPTPWYSDPLARRIGQVIQNLRFAFRPNLDFLFNVLVSHKIESVVDIGANVGQFGSDLRNSGFKGTIFSMEPGSDAYSILDKRASRDSKWQAFKIAVGSHSGNLYLNVANNRGLSSSILQMSQHLEFFTDVHYQERELVPVEKLSSLIKKLNLDPGRTLVKIDTQGYEYEILKGAESFLEDIALIYLEASLVPLYQNEMDLRILLDFLYQHNHRLIDFSQGLRTKSGKLIQIDLLTSSSQE